MTEPSPTAPRLRRELGLFGATMLGLGSVVGTGVFVAIGVAAGVASFNGRPNPYGNYCEKLL